MLPVGGATEVGVAALGALMLRVIVAGIVRACVATNCHKNETIRFVCVIIEVFQNMT